MVPSLRVEIVSYAPTAYSQCTHCEVVEGAAGVSGSLREEQVTSSLPADLAADYQQVSEWARRVLAAYHERISIRVIDAASVEGFWKTLRHGIRRYPAVFVDGKRQPGDNPLTEAEESIARNLRDLRGGVPCSRA